MKQLKYLIAWPIVRLLYWLGDFVSRTIDTYIAIGEYLDALDQNEEDVFIDTLYPLYCHLMHKSCLVDDWGGVKFWELAYVG